MTRAWGDFSRQGFLGANSSALFKNLRVAIVGLGGGGSHIAQQLAHLGIGEFRLIDPDRIASSNLNRLVGGTADDVKRRRYKVDILERLIHGVRPNARVTTHRMKWQECLPRLADAHVIFGCVDGYSERQQLERAARRYLVPYIDIGMTVQEIGAAGFAVAGQAILSLPGERCMSCAGFLTPDRIAEEAQRYGDAGINPQVVWSNGVLASSAVGLFVQLFTPWSNTRFSGAYLEYDGNQHTVRHSPLWTEFLGRPCHHFDSPNDLGHAFFGLDQIRT